MSKLFHNIIFNILGALIGFAFGVIALLFFPAPLSSYPDFFFVLSTSIIGIVTSLAIIYYTKDKQAIAEEKLRNEAVALITHEMRTSLTTTTWTIDYLLHNYSDVMKSDDKKMLNDITKSIHTTVMHTVNLLDVSLLDVGKLAISLEWTDLADLEVMFKEIVDKYSLGMKKDNIKFETSINLNKNMKVEVDRLRLRIIIENLIENSIQYTKESSKEITLDISNDDHNLKINISDNGIGIPEDEKASIFTEFYRASNARAKLSSGSGIGLHMCAQYVKAHHGTIDFESEEGVGTKFYVTIPLKTTADTREFLKQI
jgi:two-component system sensor histidine kinase VicK